MIIDTVEISNLGLWENLFLKFDKSINIIQGENGVGKTTLLALLYSLFHDSGIIKFTNKNQEAYICMNLHDSKEKLVLKKVYKKGQSGYFVSSFADIKKIARMEENKVFIFSGEFLDYDCQLNTKMIKNAVHIFIGCSGIHRVMVVTFLMIYLEIVVWMDWCRHGNSPYAYLME